MAILNVTPDSFSDGSATALDPSRAVQRGIELFEQGADIVDVGGESTRPHATPVAAGEELGRVLPVVEGLSAAGVLVSIDTTKASVARAALDAGAEIINDVSGFRDPRLVDVAVASGAGVVAMHMPGTPQTMQDDPRYDDVVAEVGRYLDERTEYLVDAGVERDCVVVDPGFGFGKTLEHNLTLLRDLDRLTRGRPPVLVGVSRKGFIGKVLAAHGVDTEPADRDGASAVAAAIAVRHGAAIVRAHDVVATLEAIAVADAIVRRTGGSQRSGDA